MKNSMWERESMERKPFPEKPPLGWNSWDCYGASVKEDEVLGNAEFMAKHLRPFGWEYITVDIQWAEPGALGTEYRNLPKLCMDEYGRLTPAPNRFPSSAGGAGFKPLGDRLHAMGLKLGIHILRGLPRQAVYLDCPIKGTSYVARDVALGGSICPWNMDMYGLDPKHPAAQAYYDSLMELYASWGVDLIKVDDLSGVVPGHGKGYHEGEAELIRRAIDKTGREIVFSSSPGMFDLEASECLTKNVNMWRVSDDFWDNWPSLLKQEQLLRDWNPHMGAGHFPDADMIPIGHLCVRSNAGHNPPRYTHLTKAEQRFLFSLWSIARSPMILGCELRDMDAFSLSLVTNADVLLCNQKSSENRPLPRTGGAAVWTAKGEDGIRWAALFNLTDEPIAYSVLIGELHLNGQKTALDVWNGRSYDLTGDTLCVRLEAHEGTLLKMV